MGPRFSPHPGRRERHLQRKHRNPLFGHPAPEIADDELTLAREGDAREQRDFSAIFRALLEEATALPANADSEAVLRLKERLYRCYEQASGLGGDQARVKEALRRLVSVIMGAVRRGAGNDQRAAMELQQETEARRMHFSLLEHALVADLLAPDSPVAPGELVPTILSSPTTELDAAMQLFDDAQLAQMSGDGRTLLNSLKARQSGHPSAGERLERLQWHLARRPPRRPPD